MRNYLKTYLQPFSMRYKIYRALHIFSLYGCYRFHVFRGIDICRFSPVNDQLTTGGSIEFQFVCWLAFLSGAVTACTVSRYFYSVDLAGITLRGMGLTDFFYCTPFWYSAKIQLYLFGGLIVAIVNSNPDLAVAIRSVTT